MKPKRNPNGKPVTIVEIQVGKLGNWAKPNPYGLFINVFRGGSLQVAEGTKRRMFELQKMCLKALTEHWGPARDVSAILYPKIPDADRPPKTH